MNLDHFEYLQDFNMGKFPIGTISTFFEATAKCQATDQEFRHIIQNPDKVRADLDFLASLFFKQRTLFSLEFFNELDWLDYYEFIYISEEGIVDFFPIDITSSNRTAQKTLNKKTDRALTRTNIYFWFRSDQDDDLVQQTRMCDWDEKHTFCTYPLYGCFEPKEN